MIKLLQLRRRVLRTRCRAVLAFALGSVVLLGKEHPALAGEKPAAAWAPVSHSQDLEVFERVHPGTSLREFKAVGLIGADPLVVKHVLEDVEAYPSFMPYVIESRTISHDATSRVAYTRLSPPIVGDRDYTIRVHFETRRAEGGGVSYCNLWEAANELGPPEKAGVTRVKVTEGSWLLEPAGSGHGTKATYTIYSDSGGALPAFVINGATKTAIPKLFDAVRKQAALPKYAEKPR